MQSRWWSWGLLELGKRCLLTTNSEKTDMGRTSGRGIRVGWLGVWHNNEDYLENVPCNGLFAMHCRAREARHLAAWPQSWLCE